MLLGNSMTSFGGSSSTRIEIPYENPVDEGSGTSITLNNVDLGIPTPNRKSFITCVSDSAVVFGSFLDSVSLSSGSISSNFSSGNIYTVNVLGTSQRFIDVTFNFTDPLIRRFCMAVVSAYTPKTDISTVTQTSTGSVWNFDLDAKSQDSLILISNRDGTVSGLDFNTSISVSGQSGILYIASKVIREDNSNYAVQKTSVTSPHGVTLIHIG